MLAARRRGAARPRRSTPVSDWTELPFSLRISEIVDAPNWVVSFYFPRVVLE